MKIIIVDDQKTVLNSLKNGIRWDELPIEEVYLASNAGEAREVLQSHGVDIMLTDIEMPGEDGLELYSWVKEHYSRVECIFLTAHADFQYAQKALQLGGCDYILQPARFEEVEQVIRKVCTKILQKQKIEELEKNSSLLKEQQELLINGIMERMLRCKEEEMARLLERLLRMLPKRYVRETVYLVQMDIIHWKGHREEWSAKLIRMVIWNVVEEMFEDLECQILVCPMQEDLGLFLILYGDGEQMDYQESVDRIRKVHEFVQQKMDFGAAFYITEVHDKDICQGLRNLDNRKSDNVMRKTDVFSDQDAVIEGEARNIRYMKQWPSYLERGDGQVVRKEIEEYCKRAGDGGTLNLDSMKDIHFNFSKAFFSVLESRRMDIRQVFSARYPYETFVEAYHTFDKLMEAVDYCLSYLQKDEHEETDCVAVATQYIHDNINQNISRKDVANLVYLNEEYFSRLFKAKMGMTFKDYVMKEKMNLAKKLLAATNFSVGIIASKAGYDNFSYFSKVFKEMEGMTPLEYRQKYKQ